MGRGGMGSLWVRSVGYAGWYSQGDILYLLSDFIEERPPLFRPCTILMELL